MTSKELREKRASDYAIMEDLQKRATAEGRLMTSDELSQWDAADASFKNYTEQISRLERWNEINSESRSISQVEQSISAMPTNAREIVKSPEYHTAFMKALAKRDLTSNEGFVVRFSNGDRMKIKGEEYLRLHRIMANLSTTSVWEILSTNGKIDEFIKDVPDEFFKKIQDFAFDLSLRHYNLMKEYTECFEIIKNKTADRKSFAEESKRYPHPSLLFGLLDGKDISPMIWKMIKPEFKKL